MNAEQAFMAYRSVADLYDYTGVTLYHYRREFARFYNFGAERYGDKRTVKEVQCLVSGGTSFDEQLYKGSQYQHERRK